MCDRKSSLFIVFNDVIILYIILRNKQEGCGVVWTSKIVEVVVLSNLQVSNYENTPKSVELIMHHIFNSC